MSLRTRLWHDANVIFDHMLPAYVMLSCLYIPDCGMMPMLYSTICCLRMSWTCTCGYLAAVACEYRLMEPTSVQCQRLEKNMPLCLSVLVFFM